MIKAIKLEEDDHLASLDVKDLFNNVPVENAIKLTLEKIGQSEKFCQSNLTEDDLRKLLELCLNNSYFTFNDKFYKQTKGMPVGSVLSPLLADLFMDEFIKKKRLKEVKSR